MTSVNHKCIIAVHAGAGYHSVTRETEYRDACAQACKKAMAKLKKGSSALEAVSVAVQCLEDSACTNAGVGSSLTMDGTVECDASIMDGQSLMYGAVGAVSDVRNPILVAQKLVEEQKNGVLSLGRIPPCTMVSKGATVWAKEHGIATVSPEYMKSESSMKTFENHKRRLDSADERRQSKRRKYLGMEKIGSLDNSLSTTDTTTPTDNITRVQDTLGSLDDSVSTDDTSGVQDTVGAVCLDMEGNMAAGVSSGGISLKQPGRLGPAALYGSGCWACNWTSDSKPGVAVATSGTGEHLMKTLLAKECAECVRSEEMTTHGFTMAIKDKFLDSEFLQNTADKFGGILAMKNERLDNGSRHCELLWGHTTDSMSIGYITSDSKPKTLISRLEDGKIPGRSFMLEGHLFTL